MGVNRLVEKGFPNRLGHPVVPFSPLFWGRVPLLNTPQKKKGTLILTSQLEDLEKNPPVGRFTISHSLPDSHQQEKHHV